MGKINIARWLLAGLVAGIIVDIGEGLTAGVVLGGQWAAAITALGLPTFGATELVAFNIFGLIVGFTAAWIYVAIRPRFGIGPRTALYAAVATWVPAYLLVDWSPVIMHVVPASMLLVQLPAGLVVIVIATIAGAYVYKEA